jgi:lipopolysaccharide/colanic/teichoic acid biosynthesis glycosyltransferase
MSLRFCRGKGISRPFEIGLALAGLVVLAPVLYVAAVLVKLTSVGPILFRQERVGREGKPFTLYKFRSMVANNGGPQVTAKGDPRVTGVGRLLRKTKLDELPELWNVVRGDLSLVGARPEVVRYVELENPLWREVLEARPGITDPVTLRLRNEEELLQGCGGDAETFYRETLQTYKLLGYREYLRERTWWSDVQVLVQSVLAVVFPAKAPPPGLDEIERVVALWRKGEWDADPGLEPAGTCFRDAR